MALTGSTELHGTIDLAASAAPRPAGPAAGQRRSAERQYLRMLQTWTRTGGLLSGTEAALRLRSHCDQPLSTVARWIVARAIVSFEWQSQILLPMFQFEPGDMAVRPVVPQILREFQGVFDDWESACWFAEPNGWLGETTPADAVSLRPQDVLNAARADRFLVRG